MKLGVVGCGAWPTTVALLLAKNGHQVHMHCHKPAYAQAINQGENPFKLPGITLDSNIQASCDPGDLADCDAAVIGLASKHLDSVDACLAHIKGKPVLSLVKGSIGDVSAMSTLQAKFGSQPVALLSGPNLAMELAQGQPAATVVASQDSDLASFFQTQLSSTSLRVYTSSDVLGVSLGGTLKNVMAIAAGLSDGMGFGENAKSTLVTRGLNEMLSFALHKGAKADTLMGLSGLGDLIATSHSPKSRNYQLGFALGQGQNLAKATQAVNGVTEGVEAAKSIYNQAAEAGIDMPITESVYQILFHGADLKQRLLALMSRTLKAE